MGMESVNWAALGVLAMVLVAVARGLLGRIAALAEQIRKLAEKVDAVQLHGTQELAAYKLEATRQYASIGYLRDVERRLLAVLEEIKDEIRELRRGRPAPAAE